MAVGQLYSFHSFTSFSCVYSYCMCCRASEERLRAIGERVRSELVAEQDLGRVLSERLEAAECVCSLSLSLSPFFLSFSYSFFLSLSPDHLCYVLL